MQENLKIQYKSISDIKCYDNNPRFNKMTIKKLENSIKKFGFNNPILIDDNNVIIAGHARYNASVNLGLDKIPCIVLKLPENEAKAYRIIDNKLSEISTWDVEKLDYELQNIISDMPDFDFESFNIDISHLLSLNEMNNLPDEIKENVKVFDINTNNNKINDLKEQAKINSNLSENWNDKNVTNKDIVIIYNQDDEEMLCNRLGISKISKRFYKFNINEGLI